MSDTFMRQHIKPLRGIRILSLALNLPGPAALLRLKALGAHCTKIEAPAGDPMQRYCPQAYAQLHRGIKTIRADLKTDAGIQRAHKLLARSDVLLTSFRPSALARLGLTWKSLHLAYPQLCMVRIVGDSAEPEIPGHDLTYMAAQDLVAGLTLPPTLFADMGGSLLATQAVLAALLERRTSGRASQCTIGLAQAAQYLALPRHWGLSAAHGVVGGAHALYQVLPCQDGRVAIAALEPHFAMRMAALVNGSPTAREQNMHSRSFHKKVATFLQSRRCAELQELALTHDLPLLTLPK